MSSFAALASWWISLPALMIAAHARSLDPQPAPALSEFRDCRRLRLMRLPDQYGEEQRNYKVWARPRARALTPSPHFVDRNSHIGTRQVFQQYGTPVTGQRKQ